MRVRLSSLVLEDDLRRFESLCLESLLAPGNIPALVGDGVHVTFSVHTLEPHSARIMGVLQRSFGALSLPSELLELGVAHLDPNNPIGYMRGRFLYEAREALAQDAAMMVISPRSYYGDRSLHNLAVYCRKRGIVTAGLSLPVARELFVGLLPPGPVSNPQLVDLALRAHVGGGGIVLQKLSAEQYGVLDPFPKPLMFWPEESDLEFMIGLESLDRLWPAKLMEERRWRYLASSDLCFFVELEVSESSARDTEFYALAHTLHSEMVVASLRREPATG